MEKFYIQNRGLTNSWFINCKHACFAKRIKVLNNINIFLEAPRRKASSMSKAEYMPYKYFTLTIKGKDHSDVELTYTFTIGVSEIAGCKNTLQGLAFNLINEVLMSECIGCLKKEALLKLEDTHLTWEYFH